MLLVAIGLTLVVGFSALVGLVLIAECVDRAMELWP